MKAEACVIPDLSREGQPEWPTESKLVTIAVVERRLLTSFQVIMATAFVGAG
jgi:hypothetical protein